MVRHVQRIEKERKKRKGGGGGGRANINIPIRSDGTFPLLNRPVGIPPLKSFPYGGKLHLAVVTKLLLLLPVSTIESPNTNTAGTETFGGNFTTAFVWPKTINNNMKRNIKEG